MSDRDYNQAFNSNLRAELDELVEVVQLVEPTSSESIRDAELLLTGWGAGPIHTTQLQSMPSLKGIFHLGGSVARLLEPTGWTPEIQVVSAREANAIPVAEFTLACILLARKRAHVFAYRLSRSHSDWSPDLREIAGGYGSRIGLIGLSAIGRKVARLLREFDMEVAAADPFATDQQASDAGVELMELDDLLRWCDIVSLHAPANASTYHLLNAQRLSLLKDGSTIVNTSRGSLIHTEALEAECKARRLHAYLDVTQPEPLPVSSSLLQLENCVVTPHIAGSLGNEVHRMTRFIIQEIGMTIKTGHSTFAINQHELSSLA